MTNEKEKFSIIKERVPAYKTKRNVTFLSIPMGIKIVKYFVYYDNDYCDSGIGIKSFDSLKDTVAFIENRITENPEAKDVDCYFVINGQK